MYQIAVSTSSRYLHTRFSIGPTHVRGALWIAKRMDQIGDLLTLIGYEYGAVLVWIALYIACTADYTLISAAYAIS